VIRLVVTSLVQELGMEKEMEAVVVIEVHGKCLRRRLGR